MRRKIPALLAAVVTVLSIGLVGVSTTSVATAATSASYNSPCYGSQNWTTGFENEPRMSSDLLKGFRAGRHATCDRLVFVLDGDNRVGYYAAYGATYLPSGARMGVAGPVDFHLTIRAWPKGWDTTRTSDDFAVRAGTVVYSTSNPKGLVRVEQVKSAGAFEGQTEFAIGLDRRVAFRVLDFVVMEGSTPVRVVVAEFDR